MIRESRCDNKTPYAQTDEQAPLPDALYMLYQRVQSGLVSGEAHDFIFNCQMGRGRTTTGMVTACLIATVHDAERPEETLRAPDEDEDTDTYYDSVDGPSEEEVYLQGDGCFHHGRGGVGTNNNDIEFCYRGLQGHIATCQRVAVWQTRKIVDR